MIRWLMDKLNWRREHVIMYIVIVIAAVVVVAAAIVATGECAMRAECENTIAHMQVQLDAYKDYVLAREERIQELENEIAAQPDERE